MTPVTNCTPLTPTYVSPAQTSPLRSKTLANCLLILFIWMFQRPLIYRPCKHQTKVMLLSSANPGFLRCFLSYSHLFRRISQYLRSHSSPTSIPSPLWHPVISHPPHSPSWMSLRFTHFLQIHPPCLKRQASLSCSSHKPGNFHYSFLSLMTPYHPLEDPAGFSFTVSRSINFSVSTATILVQAAIIPHRAPFG